MLVQKLSFLQRFRIIATAIVFIVGLGSILMSVKATDKRSAFTYGVSITSGGNHYRIIKDVTGLPPSEYDCDYNPSTACTVGSETPLQVDSEVPLNQVTIIQTGDFSSTN
jgi:hypothetical protein